MGVSGAHPQRRRNRTYEHLRAGPIIHDTLIPHLTLLETTDGQALGAAWATAADVGPFEMTVREFTVITENASGTWRTRWRLPLGGRTTRTRPDP